MAERQGVAASHIKFCRYILSVHFVGTIRRHSSSPKVVFLSSLFFFIFFHELTDSQVANEDVKLNDQSQWVHPWGSSGVRRNISAHCLHIRSVLLQRLKAFRLVTTQQYHSSYGWQLNFLNSFHKLRSFHGRKLFVFIVMSFFVYYRS